MDLLWLYIWLLICSVHHAFTSEVTRGETGDTFASEKCIKCVNHGGTCTSKYACCNKCKCGTKAQTFYKNQSTQYCIGVDDSGIIESDDNCKFFIAEKSHDGKHRTWITLPSDGTIGFLKHTSIIFYPSRHKCTVQKVLYWNLLKWEDFEANFSMEVANQKFVVKLRISGKKSKYMGRLVKLVIKCDEKKTSIRHRSCTIFKFDGKKNYDDDIDDDIELPTKPPTTSMATTPMRKKKSTVIMTVSKGITKGKSTAKRSMLIVIIIAVAATLLLVIFGIVIWCCCWRKRKSRGSKNGPVDRRLLSQDEDPNYQNPVNLPGRTSNEINGSANNLTYLQPIDALPNALPKSRYGKDNPPPMRRKDPNYDYPDITTYHNNMSKKTQSPDDGTEKPIYAEVGDLKLEPGYTRPTLVIKPRGGTQIVGVPGYQPPSGPYSDSGDSSTHDAYSSLGVASVEDSIAYQSLLEANQDDKPPSPQYAEVVPEGERNKSPEREEESSEIII